jgi:serine phosphatase RsbU (regulator of sigma subunit)
VVPLVFLTSNILLSTVFAEYLYLAGKIYSITSVAIFAYMGIVILMLLFSTDIENMQKVKPIYISHIILLLVIAAKTSIRIFFSDVEIMASNDLSNANALLMFALPLPFAYYMTIGNYHLLDLNIRFSRNILYVTAVFILRVVLTSIFLIAGYKLITLNWEFPNVVFSRTVVSLTDTPASSELQKTMEHIAIFISLIAVLAFLRYIMKIAQERIDGLFNKVNVDFRTLSARLGQIAKHGENNTDELVNTVVNTIATGMMLKKASVWLFNDEKLVSHKYFGITLNAQLAEFANLYSNDILNEMLKFKAPAPVDYLSAEVKSVLTDCSFEYVILLSTKEKNIGLLLIGEKLLESKFTKEDLTFLSDIAEHTAVVLENALMRRDIIKQERLKNEVELARKIQMASMPKASASIPGLDTAAVSKPAYEVGGDFFDFYRQQETKLAVIVGDVSGKGTSAALYMTNALGIVRTLSNFTISPRDILCNMNAIIKKQIKKGNFITAVTAEADTDRKEISISRAGHNPVFHFKAASKEIVQYKPNGLALGLTGSSTFDKVLQEQTISYNEGDIFVFITDGMCEARNENDEEVGDSIIYSVLNSYHESSAEEILKTMMHHLEKISLGNYVDDVTALIIKSV